MVMMVMMTVTPLDIRKASDHAQSKPHWTLAEACLQFLWIDQLAIRRLKSTAGTQMNDNHNYSPYLTFDLPLRIKMNPPSGNRAVEQRYVTSTTEVFSLPISNNIAFSMSNQDDWLRNALQSLPAFAGRERVEQERILRQTWQI